jgi:hypothetical protein
MEILFMISDGGRRIHEVVSAHSAISSAPEPVQTSANDWKVASEQNH